MGDEELGGWRFGFAQKTWWWRGLDGEDWVD